MKGGRDNNQGHSNIHNQVLMTTRPNTNGVIVLQEVYNSWIVKLPLMPASNRYYQEQTEVKVWLHHTYRHTTEECVVLKDQIEQLIGQGHLG